MCGRYALYSENKIQSKFNKNIKIDQNFNVTPNKQVLIIDKDKNLIKVKWGIKPSWKKTIIINARNETFRYKKTFCNLDRCVFIADGYYEWKRKKGVKEPFYHYLEKDLLFFAGLYSKDGCCIVTKESFHYLSHIHKRQPFFLKEDQIELWTNKVDVNLVFDKIINFHPVSRNINKIWNNYPELIDEIK